MNFYHFRPSCKVIKRSRISKGPFFTTYSDEIMKEIIRNPNVHLQTGSVMLEHFGIHHCYSRKVFVGGLPLDITEENVISAFNKFGPLEVDWPYKEDTNSVVPPKGFAFLLFKENYSVDTLIKSCEKKSDGYYLRLSSSGTKNKNVQIRPWNLSGIDYIFVHISKLNARHTVFVGGVPRTLNAEQLGTTMSRLFGKVSYVGIDTDSEYLYPKGAARVTFESTSSMVSAIRKRFVMPYETKTRKMMEIKPYILDDQTCDKCDGSNIHEKNTTLFCPEPECLLVESESGFEQKLQYSPKLLIFRQDFNNFLQSRPSSLRVCTPLNQLAYLCEFCWATLHSHGSFRNHKPLVKQGLEDYMNSLRRRGFD